MVSLNQPGWLFLLFVYPVMFWARFFWRGRGGRIKFPYGIWQGAEFSYSSGLSGFISKFSILLFVSGSLLLVVAMAGPEKIYKQPVVLSEGIDIVIVLDQSPSMGGMDFPPLTRFDTAREILRQFISGRTGDSIGLVTFGSKAVLRSPPTTDYKWLTSRLNDLELRGLGDSTAVGMGLAVAVLHLSELESPEKIILLLTDGDDNSGEIRPETAAEQAAALGIKIYSIGIGSGREVPIELKEPETGNILKGKIQTSLNEKDLKNIAAVTGGNYWRANGPESLKSVFSAIDSLESVERKVTVKISRESMHRQFILAGGILVLLAYILRKYFLGEIP